MYKARASRPRRRSFSSNARPRACEFRPAGKGGISSRGAARRKLFLRQAVDIFDQLLSYVRRLFRHELGELFAPRGEAGEVVPALFPHDGEHADVAHRLTLSAERPAGEKPVFRDLDPPYVFVFAESRVHGDDDVAGVTDGEQVLIHFQLMRVDVAYAVAVDKAVHAAGFEYVSHARSHAVARDAHRSYA